MDVAGKAPASVSQDSHDVLANKTIPTTPSDIEETKAERKA
jgi:hypothetical protein